MTILLARGWDWGEPKPLSSDGEVAHRVGRTGSGQAISLTTTTGTVQYNHASYSGEMFYTFWLYYDSAPSSGTQYMITFGGPGGDHLNLASNSTRFITLRRATTTLATTVAAIGLDVWTKIDVRLVPNNSGGTCIVYFDGVEVLNYTGDTTTATSDFTSTYVKIHSYASSNWWFDDLVAYNAAGSLNNTFPIGNVQVLSLMPTAAGDSAEFDSVTGDPNWQNLSDSNNTSADVNYNYSATSGDLDRYEFGNLPSQYTDIKAVHVEALTRGVKTSKSVKLSSKSGSTVTEASSETVATTDKVHTGGIMETDPNTSAAWTAAGVNALLAGVEVV